MNTESKVCIQYNTEAARGKKGKGGSSFFRRPRCVHFPSSGLLTLKSRMINQFTQTPYRRPSDAQRPNLPPIFHVFMDQHLTHPLLSGGKRAGSGSSMNNNADTDKEQFLLSV